MLLKGKIYVAKIRYNHDVQSFDLKKYSYLTSLVATDVGYLPFIKISEDKYVLLDFINNLADLYLAFLGINDYILSTQKDDKHPYYIDSSSLCRFYPNNEEEQKVSLKLLKELPF